MFRRIQRKVRDKYGVNPALFATIGWDAVKIVAHAVEIAKSDDPKKIRDGIENIKGFHLSTGEMNMSPSDHCGRSFKDIGIVAAKNGKWVGLPWVPRE